MPTTTTHPTQAAVRRGLITGKKAADALNTLVDTCNAGATCTEVQNDPVASKALGVLQSAVTTSQGSQTNQGKLGLQFITARRTARSDFRSVQIALITYETA